MLKWKTWIENNLEMWTRFCEYHAFVTTIMLQGAISDGDSWFKLHDWMISRIQRTYIGINVVGCVHFVEIYINAHRIENKWDREFVWQQCYPSTWFGQGELILAWALWNWSAINNDKNNPIRRLFDLSTIVHIYTHIYHLKYSFQH